MPPARKREARKSVQQSAWVTLEGGFAARQCVVHDMSSSGAKITVADASVLAGMVRLAFSRDARRGADLQGDLATRENIRRQVRQVKPGGCPRLTKAFTTSGVQRS
jgi:hypothetical protein